MCKGRGRADGRIWCEAGAKARVPTIPMARNIFVDRVVREAM